jgi:hypothetical protein
MADRQHTERPAGVTQAKRDSYLRYLQIHMELLQDALTGQDFGCGVGQGDLEAINKHLLEISKLIRAAKLEHVEIAQPADNANPPPSAKVLPFRQRLIG